jgi:hypothetical protein
MPIKADPICSGRENFISFLTPDSEVNVDEPVKFIAVNEEIAVMIRNHDPFSKMLSPIQSDNNRTRKINAPE